MVTLYEDSNIIIIVRNFFTSFRFQPKREKSMLSSILFLVRIHQLCLDKYLDMRRGRLIFL
jgi:hypothetical protein